MEKRLAAVLVTNLFVLTCHAGSLGQGKRPDTLPVPGRAAPTGQERRATGLKSLVRELRAGGAAVRSGGRVSQPFFSVQGRGLTVNGERVQVFEFRSSARAEAESAKVSAEGTPVGTTMVTWAGPPHFYHSGRLIVLYVGSNSGVIDTLGKALGPQFAGK